METYLCTGRLRHNGAILNEGSEIELTEEQAATLLADGAIVKSPSERKKSAPKKTPQEKPEN